MKYVFAILVALLGIAISPILIMTHVVDGPVGILLGFPFGFAGGIAASAIALSK
jgi:hypothetical protein